MASGCPSHSDLDLFSVVEKKNGRNISPATGYQCVIIVAYWKKEKERERERER